MNPMMLRMRNALIKKIRNLGYEKKREVTLNECKIEDLVELEKKIPFRIKMEETRKK